MELGSSLFEKALTNVKREENKRILRCWTGIRSINMGTFLKNTYRKNYRFCISVYTHTHTYIYMYFLALSANRSKKRWHPVSILKSCFQILDTKYDTKRKSTKGLLRVIASLDRGMQKRPGKILFCQKIRKFSENNGNMSKEQRSWYEWTLFLSFCFLIFTILSFNK